MGREMLGALVRHYQVRRGSGIQWYRLPQSLLLESLRSTFIAILPIVVVFNLLPLLVYILPSLLPPEWLAPTRNVALVVHEMIAHLLPSLVLIAHVLVLAPKQYVDRFVACAVALLSATVASRLSSEQVLVDSILMALYFSISTVYFLRWMGRFTRLDGERFQGLLSRRLDISITHIFPVMAVGSMSVLLFTSLGAAAEALGEHFGLLDSGWEEMGQVGFLVLYNVFTQVAWFLGVHGHSLAISLLEAQADTAFLQSLLNSFSTLGGSGNTFGLLIALWLCRPTAHQRRIVQIALPFSLFNINEVLIYGLPIVLNPVLLVPFFLAPMLGTLLGLGALHGGWFELSQNDVSWMAPPLYSIWLRSEGSWLAVLVQAACIAGSTLIYLPFLRAAKFQPRSTVERQYALTDSADLLMREAAEQVSERDFLRHQLAYRDRCKRIERIIRCMEGGAFELFLQPKVDSETLKTHSAEVLLRLKDKHGRVHTPDFLPDLYTVGLSEKIDELVLSLLYEQYERWRAQGFDSVPLWVNFDKAFILNRPKLDQFVEQARMLNLCVNMEITEHTYASEMDKLVHVTQYLRRHGIKVAIDDFGTGFSSLALLAHIEVDEVKLDRKLVAFSDEAAVRGQTVVQHVIDMCKSLGYLVVAEGVETQQQLQRMLALKVDMIQGFYTGRPMSVSDFEQRLERERRGAAVFFQVPHR